MRKQKILQGALTVWIFLAAAVCAAFVCDGLRHGFEYENTVLLLRIMGLMLIPGAVLAFFIGRFMAKGGCAAAEKVRRATPYADREDSARRTGVWRVCILCAAAILICLGIINGGMWDVLVKAINICTECIGLG